MDTSYPPALEPMSEPEASYQADTPEPTVAEVDRANRFDIPLRNAYSPTPPPIRRRPVNRPIRPNHRVLFGARNGMPPCVRINHSVIDPFEPNSFDGVAYLSATTEPDSPSDGGTTDSDATWKYPSEDDDPIGIDALRAMVAEDKARAEPDTKPDTRRDIVGDYAGNDGMAWETEVDAGLAEVQQLMVKLEPDMDVDSGDDGDDEDLGMVSQGEEADDRGFAQELARWSPHWQGASFMDFGTQSTELDHWRRMSMPHGSVEEVRQQQAEMDYWAHWGEARAARGIRVDSDIEMW